MMNDPITKVMQDASEIVRYDEVGIPLYIREGLLSSYPDHRALCHWHEDIEWVQIRSGQMNYCINGKRVLLNAGEAIIVNSRQMHYGYSENGQECDFICILCHPKILTANSVLYQSYYAGSFESGSGISSSEAGKSGRCKSAADPPGNSPAEEGTANRLRNRGCCSAFPFVVPSFAHASDDAGRQHRRLTGSRSSDPARYGFLYLQPLQ